jgi:4-carboxymuconolactone decarboxylase
MTPEQRKVYDAVAAGPRGKVQGPLLAALHRPELADKWQQLGELLRYRTTLPARLSEIAILVTAQRWRCQLEWHLHEGFALAAHVPRAVIDDIHAGRRPQCGRRRARGVRLCGRAARPPTRVQETYRRALGPCGAWSAWSSSPR